MESLQPQITPVSSLSDARRVDFYKKTYTHVALAVLLFIVAEYLFFQSPAIVAFAESLTGGWSWLVLLGAFMLVTNYAESMALKTRDKNKHYLALGIYVIAEAFIFIPLLHVAFSVIDGVEILQKAAVMTIALFAGLSAIVIFTKKDFSFLKAALTIGFFIALGLIIAGTIFGFEAFYSFCRVCRLKNIAASN